MNTLKRDDIALDCIHLTGIRAYGYVGFLPEERVLGQWFEVQLRLWLDLTSACQTDDLSKTLDYRNITTQVQAALKNNRVKLIETAAETIAQVGLQDSRVQKVWVCLTKLTPPIPDFTGQVSIELTRTRSAPPQVETETAP